MGEQEAISLYQKSKRFPPEVQRLIKKEVCGKWPKVFPFSNWCAYTEVIKQKQASFLENAVDNVIRGNEVINVLYFNLSGLANQVKYPILHHPFSITAFSLLLKHDLAKNQ